MPQVNAPYPDLNQMFGKQSVYPALLGMGQYQQAQRAQEENLLSAMQARKSAEAKGPMDLEKMMADIAESRARIPFMQAQTQKLNTENENATMIPLDERRQQARNKFLTDNTLDDLKRNEAEMQKIVMNPETPEPVRQRIQQMLDLMPEMRKKKMEIEGQAAIHKYDTDERTKATIKAADIAGTTRVEVARMKLQEAKAKIVDFKTALATGKVSPTEAWTYYDNMARSEADPEVRAAFRAAANDISVELQTQARAKAEGIPQIQPQPGMPLTIPQPPKPGAVSNVPLPSSAAMPPMAPPAMPAPGASAPMAAPPQASPGMASATSEDIAAQNWLMKNPTHPQAEAVRAKLKQRKVIP